VIVGQRHFDCQDVEGVLVWFGDRAGKARREYRGFVAAGFDQGAREDLRGGGLMRSVGGGDKLMENREDEGDALGDPRILGSGKFVEEILEAEIHPVASTQTSGEDILSEVCRKWGISREQLLSKTRIRSVTKARREFFLRAHEEAGESMASLARLCGLAHTSVREAIQKARKERDEA